MGTQPNALMGEVGANCPPPIEESCLLIGWGGDTAKDLSCHIETVSGGWGRQFPGFLLWK